MIGAVLVTILLWIGLTAVAYGAWNLITELAFFGH